MPSRELEILLTLKDEVSKELQTFGTKLEALKPQFKQMALVGTVGFTAVAGAIALSVSEAIKDEAAINRLTHILKTSRGATDEQVKSLLEQAKALEKVGVASAENIVQTQAQLSTFDLEAESIGTLTPAILDYVIAEKGASASTDEFKQLTNGLAQALNGNFTSLTKTGFVLDDVTKDLISNGTEAERTAALVKVLNSTYKGFNEAARNTAEGGMVAMRNEFNNLQQAIGTAFLPMIQEVNKALIPVIENFGRWAEENPELVRTLGLVTAGIFGVLAVLGTLGLVIPAIVAGIHAIGAAMLFLVANPVVLLIAGIAAIAVIVGITIYKLVKDWDYFVLGLQETWKEITANIEKAWNAIKNFFTNIWDDIKNIFKSAIDWITSKLDGLMSLVNTVKSAGSAIGNAVGGAVSSVGKAIGVKDAIITPGGQVIQTDPADYLIATKTPGALAGGIVINVFGDVSGKELIEKVKEGIMQEISFNTRFAV